MEFKMRFTRMNASSHCSSSANVHAPKINDFLFSIFSRPFDYAFFSVGIISVKTGTTTMGKKQQRVMCNSSKMLNFDRSKKKSAEISTQKWLPYDEFHFATQLLSIFHFYWENMHDYRNKILQTHTLNNVTYACVREWVLGSVCVCTFNKLCQTKVKYMLHGFCRIFSPVVAF